MTIPHKLIEILAEIKHVAVMTGAGISAESGIQTFRDPDGLWAKFDPRELASVSGFMENSAIVWDWYNHRRDIIGSCSPNPGHYAIANMQDMFERFDLITQNVDRLHQLAGSNDVMELHGNIIENHCLDCNRKFEEEISPTELPHCKYCGGKIRPSVVWFGELLPEDAFRRAEDAALNCDVFFSIGTSSEVYPAANLAFLAKNSGAIVVEINPSTTSLTKYADFVMNDKSGIVLPRIVEKLLEYKEQNN